MICSSVTDVRLNESHLIKTKNEKRRYEGQNETPACVLCSSIVPYKPVPPTPTDYVKYALQINVEKRESQKIVKSPFSCPPLAAFYIKISVFSLSWNNKKWRIGIGRCRCKCVLPVAKKQRKTSCGNDVVEHRSPWCKDSLEEKRRRHNVATRRKAGRRWRERNSQVDSSGACANLKVEENVHVCLNMNVYF